MYEWLAAHDVMGRNWLHDLRLLHRVEVSDWLLLLRSHHGLLLLGVHPSTCIVEACLGLHISHFSIFNYNSY